MCLAYSLAFIVTPQKAVVAFASFIHSLIAMLPALILVFLVMFVGYIFLKPEMIHKYLGEDSGRRGWFAACIASIFFSGPTYILFPYLKELKAQGMKNSLIAVFLNNRNVQPAFVPVMIYYFGLRFAMVFSVLVLVYALLSGLLIRHFVGDEG
jgi:uncharacterized membrane protein YraQ (UPF0718 family)